jgi:pyruvate formate lyase activating enzyme
MGEKLSAGEVFEKVNKDVEFYRNSEGGVTVSGGEPLSQPDFVAALFKLCQDKGIHTCIDTCGFATIEALEKVLPYTSLWLFDIKLSDSAAHRKWTGRPNEEILRNLRVVVFRGADVIIRVPLISGINDSAEELKNIASIAAGLKKPPKVNLLPYHRFGVGKYQMLDRQYQLSELITQKDSEMQKHKQLVESFGLECEIVL